MIDPDLSASKLTKLCNNYMKIAESKGKHQVTEVEIWNEDKYKWATIEAVKRMFIKELNRFPDMPMTVDATGLSKSWIVRWKRMYDRMKFLEPVMFRKYSLLGNPRLSCRHILITTRGLQVMKRFTLERYDENIFWNGSEFMQPTGDDARLAWKSVCMVDKFEGGVGELPHIRVRAFRGSVMTDGYAVSVSFASLVKDIANMSVA
eukprot:GHVU01116458.1.p1 GENE.GHVU01116458.1~~GHVU01116458.1.p1  ORF type:complete len:214 (-),score=16.30 GHVU01116458.1:989-1603(-)